MEQKKKVKEMLEEERPYEKCERFGVGSLTDVELLAILLRSGTRGVNAIDLARKLLYPDQGFQTKKLTHLQNWTKEELMKVHGIGKVKAIQILCLCELSKRLSKTSAGHNLDFSKPSTIAEYYMEDMRHRKQEYLKLIMLNGRSRLIGESEISKGTINMSVVSPRELFLEALHKNAVYIILLHNHPSGDPMPSKDDILVTRRVKEAGLMLGIELLDHIIIGDNCYVSLAAEGVLEDELGGRQRF